MIPRIVHYCWFGPHAMSELQREVHQKLEGEAFRLQIDSLDRERHSRELTVPHYHFKRRQWAFAADFVRLWALERTGGVYLDVDVEVLRSFDPLLNDVAFVGEESPRAIGEWNPGF